MKYRAYTSFDRDFRGLAPQHQRQFIAVLRDHFLPAVKERAFSGAASWPKRLRIHRLTSAGPAIYSLTWSFASPDGRATFHLEIDQDGDPVLVWRRIGTHRIYQDP